MQYIPFSQLVDSRCRCSSFLFLDACSSWLFPGTSSIAYWRPEIYRAMSPNRLSNSGALAVIVVSNVCFHRSNYHTPVASTIRRRSSGRCANAASIACLVFILRLWHDEVRLKPRTFAERVCASLSQSDRISVYDEAFGDGSCEHHIPMHRLPICMRAVSPCVVGSSTLHNLVNTWKMSMFYDSSRSFCLGRRTGSVKLHS